MSASVDEAALSRKLQVMLPLLDERQRRVHLASEAEAIGHGGRARLGVDVPDFLHGGFGGLQRLVPALGKRAHSKARSNHCCIRMR